MMTFTDRVTLREAFRGRASVHVRSVLALVKAGVITARVDEAIQYLRDLGTEVVADTPDVL